MIGLVHCLLLKAFGLLFLFDVGVVGCWGCGFGGGCCSILCFADFWLVLFWLCYGCALCLVAGCSGLGGFCCLGLLWFDLFGGLQVVCGLLGSLVGIYVATVWVRIGLCLWRGLRVLVPVGCCLMCWCFIC